MRVSLEKIKTLCKKKGTNIFQLEDKCGFAKGYIYKMPHHDVSYSRLMVMAKELGVAVEELFED